VQRLKGVFSSVGASFEDIAPSAEDISDTFKHIENEVDALDEVIVGHGDFFALLASRGTAAAFLKARMHACEDSKQTNLQPLAIRPV
jgi:peptidase E